MFLDAVRSEVETSTIYTNGHDESRVFGPWKDWEPSPISHHARRCCELTREWITATDFSLLNGADALTGPRWLRERFEWGPSTYPIFWCEVPKKDKLDCGTHAALAHEVFATRGVKCLRVQLVQKFSKSAVAQWNTAWRNDGAITAWIRDDRIYHEGCAVLTGKSSVKLWDSSAGWWIDAKSGSGYGSVIAVRIHSNGSRAKFQWGTHLLSGNEWTTLSA